MGTNHYGNDPNARNSEGLTLIHKGTLAGDEEFVRILLNSGVDVNLPCKYNSTPLHAAAKRGFINIVEMLLKSKADVNVINVDGETPLFCAISARQVDVIQMLLENGANVNFQGPFKNSALHYAVHESSEEIVGILLNFGADVDLEECSGHTALDAAIFKASIKPSSCNCNDEDEDRLLEECSNVHHLIINILKRHIIKLKTAGLHISEKNLRALYLKKSKKLCCFQEKCKKEVESMKSVKLQCRNTTLYDIFVNRWDPNIVEHENVVQALVIVDHEKFPIYQTLIINHLKRVLRTIPVLTPASASPAPALLIDSVSRKSGKSKALRFIFSIFLIFVVFLKILRASSIITGFVRPDQEEY